MDEIKKILWIIVFVLTADATLAYAKENQPECWELSVGTENTYWVPCGKPDDRGFNQLNCEGDVLKGIWLKIFDSCILTNDDGRSWEWTIKDGHYDIQPYIRTRL